MKKLVVLAFSLLTFVTGAIAQDHEVKFCGQVPAFERLLQNRPGCEHDIQRANDYLERYTQEYRQNRGGDFEIYQIPVVFHVIHDNGPENITDEQIMNGLEILNRDFRMLNSDIALVVDQFQSITADIGIEFLLATKDPNGNCTTGINRIQSELTYAGDDEMKDLIYWPRNKYLNVWICSDAAGAAGYTNLPGSVNSPWEASGDGIVIRADYVGSIGTSSSARSRTLTHEVGHWLNLYHTWGWSNSPGLDGNCDMDDNVDDTPNTVGWTTCTLNGSSCESDLDNVQNYMEYSYCSRMFTQGQRDRMRAAITSPVAQRNSLITQSNLVNTGAIQPALCMADFQVSRTTACITSPIQFTDMSYHNIQVWTWDFGDGTIISGTDPSAYEAPFHPYESPGIYTVQLTVSNGTDELTVTKTNLITILPLGQEAAPLVEGFEGTWPDNNWIINNPNGDLTYEVTPSTAFTGSKSLKLRNFNNTVIDNTDEMISATFDMSGMDTIYLSYRWAYSNKLTETDDRLRISSSADCGVEWNLDRIRKGSTNLPTADPTNSQFTPSGLAQWGSETLVITDEDLMNNNFRVKFEFIAKGGNNLYLDDINITAVGDGSVMVGDLEKSMYVELYPNPTSGNAILNVMSTVNQSPIVQVYSATGQLCFATLGGKSSVGKQQIDIPHLAPGMYMVTVKVGSQQTVHRLIFE